MKDIGIQTSFANNASPRILSKNPLLEHEFPQFLYQSHTVLWLFLSIFLISCLSLNRDDSDSFTNSKTGLTATLCAIIFYCAVQLPNSKFLSRPHPAFWRLINGIGVCYLALLTYLLFQNSGDARTLLKYLDPSLGVPLPDRSYAGDCRVYTPENPDSSFANILDCIFDVHMPCHAIGWFIKMLIIRDTRLCWFLSIFFEFLEISLRHQLPNFYECWWDHLILDILLCNGVGIYMGYLVCSFSEMKEYYWGIGPDVRQESGNFSTISRAALQFTPYSLSIYNWRMFASAKNFATTTWYIIFAIMVDLSNFYLKFVLWIPSNHWLLLARILFLSGFAIILTKEYYEYVESGFRIRLGSACWLGHLLLCIEWLVVYKNSEGMFNETMPSWLQMVWSGIFGLVLMAGMILFYRDLNEKMITK